jgi:hypothetical protein
MTSQTVHLYAAQDATDSFGLALPEDLAGVYRARRGYGSDFQKKWSVELQSKVAQQSPIDWEAVLDRVIEAYTLSDPVIANFEWPTLVAS